jgi:hypothetical protein
MHWYDGGKTPPEHLFEGTKMSKTGVLMVGEKGRLFAPGDYCERSYTLLGGAEDKKVEFQYSPGHFTEFARAIQGIGPRPASSFSEYAVPLTETILLGNLAVWAAPEAGSQGKRIEWDAKNLVALNAPEVEGVAKPTYRAGYSL